MGHLAQYDYVGRAAMAASWGFSDALTFATDQLLAANGVAAASYIKISCPMYLEGYAHYGGDSAGARSQEAALYVDYGGPVCYQISDSIAAWSYTASSTIVRRASLTNQTPIYLDPGAYWLVIRNTHATSAFNLRRTSAPTLLPNQSRFTSGTISALGATLNLDAAAWNNQPSIFALWAEGRVLGRSTGIVA